MGQRFDPDGTVKRRARNGERRCGECVAHTFDQGGKYCLFRWRIPGTETQTCRADDYAGDCKHFATKGE